MKEKLSRRDFVGWGLRTAAAVPLVAVGLGSESTYVQDIPGLQDTQLEHLPQVVASEIETTPETQVSLWLHTIEEDKERFMQTLDRSNFLVGFRGLRKEQIMEDASKFYPFYKAAEHEYGVPASLLMITHCFETTFSRNSTPEASGYVGSMQRDADIYPYPYVAEAAKGWDFLGLLEQRYSQPRGFITDDYEEILFAARKMREDAEHIKEIYRRNHLAEVNPERREMPDTEALEKAQFNYCAEWTAWDRIRLFEQFEQQLAI